MVKRKGLGDLLRQEVSASTPVLDASVTSEHRDLQSSDTLGDLAALEAARVNAELLTAPPAKSKQTSDETNVDASEQLEGVPSAKYLMLVRKETRLREEQYDELTRLARKLNKRKSKTARTERITENTLIRVAIDVLLDRADALNGDDEAALLATLRRAMT
ncbi:hypothetical protein DES52_11697 [Deinococcus yavapaiensis KR-236]|uniref:Uncharacterized protein n=1 Tax=Deinococcus yavapaiensis KR-236 TaxID=694435 RepID=A0A318S767_9DEIO|nr:hypothetical protein DES52_11697 [Deinococcus yavapaiensis KR-236]